MPLLWILAGFCWVSTIIDHGSKLFFLTSDRYNICPGTDLSFLDIGSAEAIKQAADIPSQDKCAVLDKTPGVCETKYNFTSTGLEAINPLNLPPAGKELMSNLPGNAFTDGGNQVLTVVLEDIFPFQKVVTLAPWNSDAAAAGATGTAKVTGSGAQASRTGTGAAGSTGESSATPTNAAGLVNAPDLKWSGGALALAILGMW